MRLKRLIFSLCKNKKKELYLNLFKLFISYYYQQLKMILMKKLILLGLTVLSLQITAQEKRSELQKMTPEQKTALQVKQMTLDLDLNAEQQKKVATIMEAQTKERMAKIDALKAKKDKGEKISADERYQLMNEHLDNQIELKSKLKSVLTEEQMQKWEAKQEKMKSKMANRKRKAATTN